MSAFDEVAAVDVIAGAVQAKAPVVSAREMPGRGLGPVPSCASNYSIATEPDDRDDVAVADNAANESFARTEESDAGDITIDITVDAYDEAAGAREQQRQGCVAHFFSTIGLGCRQIASDFVSCATCAPYELVEAEVQLHPEALAEEARLVAQENAKLGVVAAPAPKRDNVTVRDSKTASIPITLSQSLENNTFLDDASTLAGTKILPEEEEPTSSFFGMFSCAPHQNEVKKVIELERKEGIISENDEKIKRRTRSVSEDGDGLITPDDLNEGDGKSDGVHGKQSKEADIDLQRQNSAFDPVGHLLLNQYESFESIDAQTLDKNGKPVLRSRSLDAKHLKAKSVGVKKLAENLLPRKPAARQKSVLDSVPAAIKSAPESVQRKYFDAVSKTAVVAAEVERRRAELELKKIELESRRLDNDMAGFLDGAIVGGASTDESTTFDDDLDIMMKHVARPFLSWKCGKASAAE